MSLAGAHIISSLRAITWLIMAISPLCSNSRETRGTSGGDYIEKDRTQEWKMLKASNMKKTVHCSVQYCFIFNS